MPRFLRRLMSATEIESTLSRVASEISSNPDQLQDAVIVGIRRRGVPLAEKIRDRIAGSGIILPLGSLDITFYRDDFSQVEVHPVVEGTDLPFDLEGKRVVLVDDVLFSGRTVRAAIDSVLDFGRPRRIELFVLIDRGHRELPIQADFVGRYVETAPDEVVDVRIPPFDEETGVYLTTRELLAGDTIDDEDLGKGR